MPRLLVPSLSRDRVTIATLLTVAVLGGCANDKIVFVYPDEAIGSRYRAGPPPAVYVDSVTDLRPAAQREGQGSFFKITYPKDESWEVPATQIYAEALAQDLQQTALLELVPLRGQAEYVLAADLVSLGCRLERSPWSFALTGALGAGLGLALGDDGSHRTKLAIALGAVAVLAVPVPTTNRAEAEVRLVLRDGSGDIVWQASCRGEYEGKKAVTPTARQDQQLVNEHLTKAVKRANACLLGQLTQFLQERVAGAP
jgi:hypothetical protein